MSSYSASKTLAVVVTSCVLTAFLVSQSTQPTTQQFYDTQPAFTRIMAKQTLRCGYVLFAPGTMRDPTTGAISGIAHDVVEAAAAKLKINVEWAEETSWGSHLEGLKTGRYDMLCASSYTLPSDAAQAEPIGPLYFSGLGVYVRADDHRFDNNLSDINTTQTVISAIDGTIPAIIASELFPNARLASHPQLTDYMFNIQDVVAHKADVTFVETYYGSEAQTQNPGKLRNVAKVKPLRIYHNNLLVNKGEFKLRSMFQTVIAEMLNNGELDAILDKYERHPNALIRVGKPFGTNN